MVKSFVRNGLRANDYSAVMVKCKQHKEMRKIGVFLRRASVCALRVRFVRPAPTGRGMPPVVITVMTVLMAFGRKLLANPEMPERLRRHAPLNRGDLSTYDRARAKGAPAIRRSTRSGATWRSLA
jgi:2,4-dienoyl-CoA reductase-like NADH-dependent reductase (Old Yellow Enzyme family)